MKKNRRARYCRRAAALSVVLLFTTACAPDPDELVEGQEPYLRFCASCHGNEGGGKPPAFPPIAGSEWLDLGPDAIALVVLGGLSGEIEVAGRTYRGYMPPMRQLSDQEIAGLLGYIGRAWTDWERLPEPARIAELRPLVAGNRPTQGLDGLEALLEQVPAE
ncbi:cytochrome c [Wenzhouxiangella sp. XN79A]|uniref:c-type cytochrome n=1 Tax=Wenzhouxiangella sp. XN79A TaxID=2724193 RepID=UPI00144A9002|nr:cytochrome c [Wenzhouxiangella sp. XN79A]NKI35843.1 cytochrome c [Wenzhouxiangella sp. XN79A]